MMNKAIIPRRTFLKGLGAVIALPMMESMSPVRAAAATIAAGKPPVRTAFMFVPNGVHLPDWTPTQEGANFKLPYILDSLNPLRRDLLVLSGLTQDKGRANGDGPGDHARSAAAFLTGVQPLKSEGSQIRAGISADQFIAENIKNETRFGSLEIGVEGGRQAGKCDSGYSCAYSNNISWRNEVTPMTKETDPRLVFERLFGTGESNEANSFLGRRHLKKSILDFVMEDARRLNTRISGADRRKLDEYLTAIREIELRVQKAEQMSAAAARVIEGVEKPSGKPDDRGEHIRLLGDMMILAFQADVTRVCTFMLANEGSNSSYRQIGVSEGHHTLSHHQGDPVKQKKIAKINRYHADQVAYILTRMKNLKEPDGSSLLDNSMIVYGAGISDGNRHNNENLPIVLAGKGGGTIRTGRHVRYAQETPLNNLFISMMDRMGVHTDTFGDGTGALRGLEA
jgi:hypothetical protein